MIKYALSDYYIFFLLASAVWLLWFFVVAIAKRVGLKGLFKFSYSELFYFAALAIGFSFLGITIGLMVGLSQSPVVGVVIPALMTFLGGFIIYAFIFGESTPKNGIVMVLILVSISFFLTLGSDYGATMREQYETNQRKINEDDKRQYLLYEERVKSGKTKGIEITLRRDSI